MGSYLLHPCSRNPPYLGIVSRQAIELPGAVNELTLKITDSRNPDVEHYLSASIMDYGIAQLEGHSPRHASCAFSSAADQLVGGVFGYSTLNLFVISYLFVNEAYRNQGLGKRLLQEIERIASQHACNIIRLNTLNKQVTTFYTNAGYLETVTIQEYMEGFNLVYYEKSI